MTTASFTPTYYLLEGCPFCLKLRIFLLESGLQSEASFRTFARGSAEEAAIRSELQPHLENVSFPAAQIAPSEFLTDSDAIISRLGVAPGAVLQTYVDGVFKKMLTMYRENMELKKQLAGQG